MCLKILLIFQELSKVKVREKIKFSNNRHYEYSGFLQLKKSVDFPNLAPKANQSWFERDSFEFHINLYFKGM